MGSRDRVQYWLERMSLVDREGQARLVERTKKNVAGEVAQLTTRRWPRCWSSALSAGRATSAAMARVIAEKVMLAR